MKFRDIDIPIEDGVILDEGAQLDFDHPHLFRVPGGEQVKTFDWYKKAIEFFLSHNITRNFHLWGIGGGATTDLTGFVASTLLRGVKWSSIPTTLLGQVDAAIGGKTAINSPQGKNLIGTFWNPEEVYLCPEFLETLSERDINSGKGEILKYGLLNSQIKDLILKKAPLDKIIQACFEHKKLITTHDLTEQGERISLNMGHTIGHIIESKFLCSHGEAVAFGLLKESEIFSPDKVQLIQEMAWALELVIPGFPLGPNDLLKWGMKDKKRVNSDIRFVVPGPLSYQVIDCAPGDIPL